MAVSTRGSFLLHIGHPAFEKSQNLLLVIRQLISGVFIMRIQNLRCQVRKRVLSVALQHFRMDVAPATHRGCISEPLGAGVYEFWNAWRKPRSLLRRRCRKGIGRLIV